MCQIKKYLRNIQIEKLIVGKIDSTIDFVFLLFYC